VLDWPWQSLPRRLGSPCFSQFLLIHQCLNSSHFSTQRFYFPLEVQSLIEVYDWCNMCC
jgi:hypothetical protein